jgi:hypothetical protein
MESGRQAWARAILVGIAYGVIGVVVAALDDGGHVRMWRLAAWVVSAAVFAAHIGYEHYGLGSPRRTTALRVAGAAALGAFALALAANIHALSVAASGQQARLLIALVVWPVMIALPAFLVALAGAAVLARLSRHA